MFKFDEKMFDGNLPVKYVFEEGIHNQDFLVVVFSGFNSVRSKSPYNYNYIRTLRNIDCNKLFILDNYGPRGSYYLGANLNFDFEEAVYSLIKHIAMKNNVPDNNIITAGSSKGGSAALYFGLKYNLGHIVAGAPQTKIADYINKYSKETLDYILGGNLSEERYSQLNDLITNQAINNSTSQINILTSEHDDQFSHHIVPFEHDLKTSKVFYQIDVNNDILGHNDIASHYTSYICRHLLRIIYGIKIKEISVEQGHMTEWNLKVIPEDGNKVESQVVVKDQDEKLYSHPINGMITFDKTTLEIDGLRKLELSLSISQNNVEVYSYPLETIFSFNGHVLKGTNFTTDEDNLYFEILIDDHPKLEYAFYVRKNNEVIEKIMYKKDRKLVYPIKGSGTYQIHYFIRANNEKYSNRSKSIVVK